MNYAMLLARRRRSTLPPAIITITSQPTNATISSSGSPPYTASVTVQATVTRGTLLYRWQLFLNQGGWVDLDDLGFTDGGFSGTTSQTATQTFLNPPSPGNDTSTLRCVLSAAGAASVTSDTVAITTV